MSKKPQLHIDKELSSLIPPLRDEELAQLEQNIVADGCRDPLVVWVDNNILLDGHNRYRICTDRGIPFETRAIALADGEAAAAWIIHNQIGRRNISTSIRAILAAKLANLRHGQKKGDRSNDLSQADSAELFGVSVPSVKRAEVVLSQGTPELQQAVMSDQISVSTAAEIATLAPDEQAAVLEADGKDIIAKAAAVKNKRKKRKKRDKDKRKAEAAKNLPATTERYTIHHGTLADIGTSVADESIDWIITDPPYPEEFLPLYSELSAFAGRVLKPGGSLLCMVGQSFLPNIVLRLAEHLSYHWTAAYLTPGGQAVQLWQRKINTFWKPLLWFVKGKYKGDWIGDVCRSEPNDNDKNHHHWGQSESGMADIIERFTDPGQTICDPFGGAMTTGVVAVRMNRLFIGIDCDAEAVQTGLARLAKAVQ